MKDIKVTLPNGNVFDLHASERFFEAVKKYFNLGSVEEITDADIRTFIFKMTSNALDKTEREGLVEEG